ncbi:MAG: HlyD family efflux transporter periplasmic adaptor subunit [Pseudomonadota bacterium]
MERRSESTVQFMSWGNRSFITSPSSGVLKVIFLVIFVFLVFAVGFCSLYSVDLTVDSTGQVIPAKQVRTEMAPCTGQVASVISRAGQVSTRALPVLQILCEGKVATEKAVLLPENSRLLAVQVDEGQTLKSGDPLFTFEDREARRFFEALVSDKDVHRIESGNLVYVSLEAFPKTKHGYLKGQILEVDQVPVGFSSETAAQLDGYYRVKAEIAKDPESGVDLSKIYLGMGGEMKIVWKKATIWQILELYFLPSSS